MLIVMLLIILVLAAIILAVRTTASALTSDSWPPTNSARLPNSRRSLDMRSQWADRIAGDERVGGNPHDSRIKGPIYSDDGRAHHPLGDSLHEYVRDLRPEHAIGIHPLDRDRYEPLDPPKHAIPSPESESGESPEIEGGRALARQKYPVPKKAWFEYESWQALSQDDGATAQYFEQRAAVLNNPNLDWKLVLREIEPKLYENREYIGIINLDRPGGKTLRVVAYEASPIEAGRIRSETTYAFIPDSLHAKYAKRPALFIFHTHPADSRCNPLPSSNDLSTSIRLASVSQFAASVVISRYGVLVHGLSWEGYKAINESKDSTLAMLNLCHDVVAAHEAIRSWSEYTIKDYLAFYARHRLLITPFPSAEMTSDSRRYVYLWDLELPTDRDVIATHGDDITAHLRKIKSRRGKNIRKKLTFGPGPAVEPELASW